MIVSVACRVGRALTAFVRTANVATAHRAPNRLVQHCQRPAKDSPSTMAAAVYTSRASRTGVRYAALIASGEGWNTRYEAPAPTPKLAPTTASRRSGDGAARAACTAAADPAAATAVTAAAAAAAAAPAAGTAVAAGAAAAPSTAAALAEANRAVTPLVWPPPAHLGCPCAPRQAAPAWASRPHIAEGCPQGFKCSGCKVGALLVD